MSEEEHTSEIEEGGEEEAGREEGEEEELGEEEAVADKPLTEEVIAECLSLLCKTGDGLSHAYVRLDVHEREITDISLLEQFIHLRYVDVTKNSIKDISPLNSLTQLLLLRADYNSLTSASLESLPYLQVASFANNRITSTEGIHHPLLEQLSLNYNNIPAVMGLDCSALQRLHTLELRGNKLTTTAGLNLPNLKNLFLAENLIKKLEDLDRMVQLTTLHLRENQLETLDGFSELNAKLQYINLRGNSISDVKELNKLKCLPLLRAISLFENPCTEEDDYRQEALIALRTLERLDKDEFSEEEKHEAEEIAEQRKEEEAKAQGEPAEEVEEEA
ncbi:leucine-rich repeat-containing protein 23-like [Watersipora subatra]|uniref:leucine-rich repeat-containing protein 23-like n=1 Tax=Watersipora subatra TaxID=2589382 RepID=UPI00355C1A2E